MGMLDREPRFAECIGVPIYSINTTTFEHVGDGSIMLTGWFRVQGVYVPQYHSVMNYRTMLSAGSGAVLKAQNVMMEIGAAVKMAH